MSNQEEHDRIGAELTRADPSNDPFAAAVRATRMPMLVTDPNQPDNPIVFVNAAFSKLTGYDHDEIIGRNCRFLQGPMTDAQAVADIREAVKNRVSIEIDIVNHKKDGEYFWNRLLISPVFDRAGRLTYFFASQFDVTLEKERFVRLQKHRDDLEIEVSRRTADLVRNEEQLQFILKAGRLGAWSLTLSDLNLDASSICKENFGRSIDDDFTYGELLASVAPEDQERMQSAVQQSIQTRGDYDIEYRVLLPNGERRWVQIRGRAFYDADGTPLRMAGVSIDIDDRKRAEEHRKLLTGELNHRVKNTMATIQSIAHQTLRSADTLGDARVALNSRLVSLASAHDILTRESWEGANLSAVIKEAMQPFQPMSGSTSRIRVEGPSVWLSSRASLALMMGLHEMATNAVKHGALSVDEGHVSLTWRLDLAGETPHLRLRWEERGGPAIAAPTRRGFGSRVLGTALPAELGGDVQIDYAETGVVMTIDAPLEQLRCEG